MGEMETDRPSLRSLMLKRSAWFEERVLELSAREGYENVTPSMARLFAYLRKEAVSISELARRLGVTRQACHQTVSEACRRGLAELVKDPADARVRTVRFTEKGLEMARVAKSALLELDAELERRIGAEDVATLRRILQQDW